MESTVRRLVIAHVFEIPIEVLSNNEDDIFNEFEETFQRLAE